jgi:hypothetical protein
VTTRSHAPSFVTPWPLWQGLVIVVVVPTYVTLPQHEGDWHRLLCCPCYVVTPPTQWTELCGAPTIMPYCSQQQLVRTCQSPHLGMAARLWFQGLSLPIPCHAQFQGPSVQFIDLEVVGLLSTSCHRTSPFTVMLDIPV